MEGYPSDQPYNASKIVDYRPDHITLADPSLEGDYPVMELTYGSGHLSGILVPGRLTLQIPGMDLKMQSVMKKTH